MDFEIHEKPENDNVAKNTIIVLSSATTVLAQDIAGLLCSFDTEDGKQYRILEDVLKNK